MRLSCAFVALACAACSIDEYGNLPPLADAGSDVIITPDVIDEPGPPEPCTLAPGACVAALAAGWTITAFDPTAEATCPSNFIESPLVYDPQPQAGACDCGCSVTQQPACNLGLLPRMVSNDTSCGMTGVTLTVAGSGCNGWPPNTTSLDAYAQSSPLAPTLGSCTANAVANPSAVGSKVGRMCTPPSACVEQMCEGTVPTGLSLCVVHDGAQSLCPGGFGPTPMVVGDAIDLACSMCTCDMTGSTCTNASIDIYGDNMCKTTKLASVPVDGNCDADSAGGSTARGFVYNATPNGACAATGPKTANATLTNQKTICCK